MNQPIHDSRPPDGQPRAVQQPIQVSMTPEPFSAVTPSGQVTHPPTVDAAGSSHHDRLLFLKQAALFLSVAGLCLLSFGVVIQTRGNIVILMIILGVVGLLAAAVFAGKMGSASPDNSSSGPVVLGAFSVRGQQIRTAEVQNRRLVSVKDLAAITGMSEKVVALRMNTRTVVFETSQGLRSESFGEARALQSFASSIPSDLYAELTSALRHHYQPPPRTFNGQQ